MQFLKHPSHVTVGALQKSLNLEEIYGMIPKNMFKTCSNFSRNFHNKSAPDTVSKASFACNCRRFAESFDMKKRFMPGDCSSEYQLRCQHQTLYNITVN